MGGSWPAGGAAGGRSAGGPVAAARDGVRRGAGRGPESPAGGPDLGPSSAATTGVGTMEPPGHGIPLWSVHPEATAVANGTARGPVGRNGAPLPRPPDAGARPGGDAPSAAGGPAPLPRQTGALQADALGRDELGSSWWRLRPPSPPARRRPRAEPGG